MTFGNQENHRMTEAERLENHRTRRTPQGSQDGSEGKEENPRPGMREMRMRRMARMRHGARTRMSGMRMRRVLLQKMRKHRTDGGILRDENRRRVPISAIRRKTRHRMRNPRKGISEAHLRYGRRRLIRQRTGIQNRGRSYNDNAPTRKKMMNHRLIRDI